MPTECVEKPWRSALTGTLRQTGGAEDDLPGLVETVERLARFVARDRQMLRAGRAG